MGIDFINFPYTNGTTTYKTFSSGYIAIIPDEYIDYSDWNYNADGSSERLAGVIIKFNDTFRTDINTNITFFEHQWRYASGVKVILFNDETNKGYAPFIKSGGDTLSTQYNVTNSNFIGENNKTFADEIIFNSVFIGINSHNIFRIENLSINNIDLIENNEIPTFNISYDDIQCLNDTIGSIQVNLTYEVNDLENDTIYYADKDMSIYSDNRTVLFYERVCYPSFFGLFKQCVNNINYDFLDYTYIPENACEIETESYNESKFNIYYNDEWGLRLNNCSETDKSFYFNIGIPTNNLNYITEIKSIDDNDYLNISLIGEDLTEIAKINLIQSDNRLLIYNYNGSDLNLVGNITAQEDTLLEFNDINVNENTLNFRVWESGVSLPYLSGSYNNYTIDILNNNPIKYVRHSITEETDLMIMGLQFRGTTQELNFTTEQITNYTVSEIGEYVYTIYISDNIHYPDEYITEDIYINVFPIDFCFNPENIYDTNDDLLGDFENDKNLSGFKLFFAKLIWFMQFPYRMALHFDLLTSFYIATTIIIIFIGIKIFTLVSMSGGENAFSQTIYFMGFVSILIFFTKLIWLPLFIFIMFLNAVNIAKDLFSHEG